MENMKINKNTKLDILKLLLRGIQDDKWLFEQIKRGLDCPSHYIPVKYRDLYDYFEGGCENRDCDDCSQELFNLLLSDNNEEEENP